MTDETRPANQALPYETATHGEHEIQRNWQQLLDEVAHKALDGSVAAAAGYATKKALDRITGEHPHEEPPKQDPSPGDNPPS
jgi:hypothetical protein